MPVRRKTGGAADGLKLLCDMLEHRVAALHAVGSVDGNEAVEVDGQDVEGLFLREHLVHAAQEELLIVQAGEAVGVGLRVVDGGEHRQNGQAHAEPGRQNLRMERLIDDAADGKEKRLDEREGAVFAQRPAVNDGQDQRGQQVQRGADIHGVVERPVPIAPRVKIKQRVGERVGQDDEGQRQGGHGHDEQLARREPPVFNQHPDIAEQGEGQERLKQKEHVRRELRADAERVGASGNEPVADEIEDDIQQAEDDDIAEDAVVQVDDLRFPAADVQQNQRQQQQGAPEKVRIKRPHASNPPIFFR